MLLFVGNLMKMIVLQYVTGIHEEVTQFQTDGYVYFFKVDLFVFFASLENASQPCLYIYTPVQYLFAPKFDVISASLIFVFTRSFVLV